MSSSYLPLKWESTGEQWWYATPIDWAAANGQCDLVKELIRIDPNLLIKLTSLRRIRRLETVWDDADSTNAVARCRAGVAHSLLSDSLIRAGYGGWLLYTAASAGDAGFVRRLIEKERVSVLGEGEYGITDILYAAARSKNSEVFRLLLNYAIDVVRSSDGEDSSSGGEVKEGFLWELMNRAVHAAARGGNFEVLKELLWDCPDVLAYRDNEGFTLLHSAANRGQVEVVKGLIETYHNVVNSADNQGNTALHVAAYRGYSSVVKVLASTSLSRSRNNDGDTFLHMAIAGFRSPSFHRIEQQIELMKQLVDGNIINLTDIINVQNNDGRTPLHVAVAEDVHSSVAELLMNVQSIDLNVRDVDGFTPLDLLKRSPKTATSEILMRKMTSAGGISYGQDDVAPARLLNTRGIVTSPGTSFRFPDAELCLSTGNDNDSEVSCEPPSSRSSSYSSETESQFEYESNKRSTSKRLMFPLQWAGKGEKKSNGMIYSHDKNDKNELESFRATPLRQRFSRASSKCEIPNSLAAKENFKASLMQGVIMATPPKSRLSSARHSRSSTFSKLSISSPATEEILRGQQVERKSSARHSFFSGPLSVERSQPDVKHRRTSSFSKSLMNQYFCFGAQGLAVEDSVTARQASRSCRRLVF